MSEKRYTTEMLFDVIAKQLKADSKPIEGLNAVYQFDIAGETGGTYQLHVSDGSARVEKGSSNSADCFIKMKENHFVDMLLGRLTGTAAFMTGKIKVNGSIGLAMKLQNILGSYNPQY
ncbi:MAG TPA: SCP2 sterol-binding domain-containing protein [Bacillales bacterium]|jgi:putative sterol carrier protein|nr:SCP2 sterol-binding domain-containing protein [Bacillales bacterium]